MKVTSQIGLKLKSKHTTDAVTLLLPGTMTDISLSSTSLTQRGLVKIGCVHYGDTFLTF